MAHHTHYQDDDQTLRGIFDWLYGLDMTHTRQNIAKAYRRLDRRTKILAVMTFVFLIAVWGLISVMNASIEQARIASMPNTYELLMSPYDLETRLTPLDNVTVRTWTLTYEVAVEVPVEVPVDTTTADTTQADAATMNTTAAETTGEVAETDPSASDVVAEPVVVEPQTMIVMETRSVDVETIVLLPEFGPFTIRPSGALSLLGQCLTTAYQPVDGAVCSLGQRAQFMEVGYFVDDEGIEASIVATQFANADEAGSAIQGLFNYSRSIGRVGSYVLMEARSVDYYYSTTRNTFSFTWTNGPWLYTVSSTRFTTLEAFMQTFPY